MKRITAGVVVLILLGAAFLGGHFFWPQHQGPIDSLIEEAQNHDLQIPGETKKRVITEDECHGQLEEIKDLTTHTMNYHITHSEDTYRATKQGTSYPLTKNTVALECDGIVKVGCSVDDISIVVDKESETVYLTLPSIVVLDNYVIMESANTEGSKNNPLNPLSFEDYQEVLVELEEKGLQQAKDKGIFDEARKTLELTIRNSIGSITDYDIVFM